MGDPHAVANDLEEVFERDQAERLAFAVWWIDTVGPLYHRHLRLLFSESFTERQVERLVDVFILVQKGDV